MGFVTQLDPEFVANYKDKTPPWGPIGYVVYKRTYARPVVEENRKEEWWETVERCCNGLLELGGKFTKEEIEALYDSVFNLHCCFSGRALWQLGTDTVRKNGQDSLQSCWLTVVNHPVDPFCFLFNELMLGGGVGFNIHAEHVYELPVVAHDVSVIRKDERDVDFIVPDNREGWVSLLRKTLEAFFYTGKNLTYSTICIRGYGAPIKGFGGTASGPEELVKGIEEVCSVLRRRVGKKLRPVDCLDICNILGGIVVAGNVRRSAEIAVGGYRDIDYLKAKNWGEGAIPNWRAMSNNSVVVNDVDKLPHAFWKTYEGDSEPYGILNLDVAREYGRLADPKGYRPDPRVEGTNPCGEQFLEDKESCNLGEIFLPRVQDERHFKQVAALMTKVLKTIASVPAIYEETNRVIQRNRRIGLGVTGFLQAPHLMDEKLFHNVYRHVEDVDWEYSKTLGVNPSIKLTTVKPSGTLSLLPGVTPGVHPAFAKYCIRRIRIDADDPLVFEAKKKGYHVEPKRNFDGSKDTKTMVVEFPIAYPDGTVVAEDVDAIVQLEYAKWLQRNWSDNAVSVTVYYTPQELPGIKQWLRNNWKEMKSVSFLLREDHGFDQAPFEEIGEEKYMRMTQGLQKITRLEDSAEETELDDLGCSGGHCPVK